ncbi:MAG: DUF5683 domain-containing protein [candidate division WOR-3 bacterium]
MRIVSVVLLVFLSINLLGTPVETRNYHRSAELSIALSLMLPGGGQFYCEEYFKGTLFLATEGLLSYYTYKNHKAYILTAHNEYLMRRNNFLWWLATVKAISLADAYISAQMYKFNEQMELGVDFVPPTKTRLFLLVRL